jgi:hypothetical protein
MERPAFARFASFGLPLGVRAIDPERESQASIRLKHVQSELTGFSAVFRASGNPDERVPMLR